jgi:sugar lactone lactonase YvrE
VYIPELVCHPQCELAESPVWHQDSGTLYFIDIKKRLLYAQHMSGILEKWPLSSETGSIVLNRSGELFAAQQHHFVSIHLSPFREEVVATTYDEPAHNRFNDGKCDPQGRFWASTMDDNCKLPTGSIWSLDHQLTVHKHESGFIVGNGFGWNLDGTRMYFTDSEKRKIYAWEFDGKQGTLGKLSLFATIAADDGLPDGLCVDSEDHVWSAHWDGGKISRYHPDGTVERTVSLPVPRPTSLAFGGNNFSTLFITTARHQLSEEQLREAPLSGAILSINCEVPGLPSARFGHQD